MKNIILFFILLFSCCKIDAATINEFVFFGDSLSDNGNLYRVVKIMPKSPPYYRGQFSNGPVWAELLGNYYRNKYGISYKNFAVGGSSAIYRGPLEGALPYTLENEVNKYLDQFENTDKSNILFFIWMGGNDFMDEHRQLPQELATNVLNEIVKQMKKLITNGARNFVVFDLPNFSAVPYAQSLDESQKNRLTKIGELYHQQLPQALNKLKMEYPNFNFLFIDAFDTFNDMLNNIQNYNQKYNVHISNTFNACWQGGYTLTGEKQNPEILNSELQQWLPKAGVNVHSEVMADFIIHSRSLSEVYAVAKSQSLAGTACPNPDEYMFWDTVHPSAATHQMLSKIIIEKLEGVVLAPVPVHLK